LKCLLASYFEASKHEPVNDFIKQIKVTFDGKAILTAKTDIAISSDPNFRFYFVPKKKGELKAEFTDTSCESPVSRDVCQSGKTYTKVYQVVP
jgi:sulfur-oxidizing protein SoxY